jgi:hypothetical protein
LSTQEVLVELGAAVLLASSIVLMRRRLLSIRYGLGWIAVSLAGLAVAPILVLLASKARVLGFTETGFSLGIFIGFIILLCLQLSISLSGLHHAVRNLGEHAALLEERVQRLESSDGEDLAPRAPDPTREWSGRP